MALEGMGPILPYYWRKFTQINFQTGDTLGLTYIICFLSILTLIVLCFLAALILKARSHAPENRFMAILLLLRISCNGFLVQYIPIQCRYVTNDGILSRWVVFLLTSMFIHVSLNRFILSS